MSTESEALFKAYLVQTAKLQENTPGEGSPRETLAECMLLSEMGYLWPGRDGEKAWDPGTPEMITAVFTQLCPGVMTFDVDSSRPPHLVFRVENPHNYFPLHAVYDSPQLAAASLGIMYILNQHMSRDYPTIRVGWTAVYTLLETGGVSRVDLGCVEVEREEFANLDLYRVDPSACLKSLITASPHALRTGNAPRPQVQPYGISDRGAEIMARDWMRYLGLTDAEVTQFVGDGGIDVNSQTWVAQVKNYTGTVTIESVRALAGVAVAAGKRGMFFTTGAYPESALRLAHQLGLALFTMTPEDGTIEAHSDAAREFFAH